MEAGERCRDCNMGSATERLEAFQAYQGSVSLNGGVTAATISGGGGNTR